MSKPTPNATYRMLDRVLSNKYIEPLPIAPQRRYSLAVRWLKDSGHIVHSSLNEQQVLMVAVAHACEVETRERVQAISGRFTPEMWEILRPWLEEREGGAEAIKEIEAWIARTTRT